MMNLYGSWTPRIGELQGGLGEEVWTVAAKQIAVELDCPVENVIMSATHSHSAVPAGPPASGVARPPQQATAPTVAAILDAVRQAKAKLQPAQVGFGTGFSYLNAARDSIGEETHLWIWWRSTRRNNEYATTCFGLSTLRTSQLARYIP